MKYLLLLLGVAQAKDLLLKRRLSSEISWDIIEDDVKTGEGSAPCPLSDDAVHAAMCGRALSSSDSGSSCVDRQSGGDCETGDGLCKWYDDRSPKCQDAPSDSDGSGPTTVNCHGIHDSTHCGLQIAAGCSWYGDECHCDGASDCTSGPTCGYVVKDVVKDNLPTEFLNRFNYNELVACTTAECTEMKSFNDILHDFEMPHIIDHAIEGMQTEGYTFDCCENSMISLTVNQITYFMDNTFVVADVQLPISILEQINHYMAWVNLNIQCSNLSQHVGVDCDYGDIMGILFHPEYSIFSQDTTAEIEACVASAGPSDGPSELPTCTYRYSQGDCEDTEDGRTCVWDGSSCDEHPCDTITCSGDLIKKSPYPDAGSINVTQSIQFAQCCKPERKGCKDDSTSYTYDPTVDVHNSSLCFTEMTLTKKENEVTAVSGYLAKRAVHKGHAKIAFYKKRAEGSTKKDAIRAARETIRYDDLPQRVKDRKRATVKVAVAVNDATVDTCRAGVGDDNCVSLDLAEDRDADETTILLTEDEEGSWAVVADGQDLIIKQTRFIDSGEVKFTLQCWVPEHSDWSSGPSKSPSDDDNIVTHKCGSHVFMVGSLQQVCVDCADGCDEAAGLCYVPGCTNATACNYNALANKDDGSCTYAAENYACDGRCVAAYDCTGTCGGNANVDAVGVCNGQCEADVDRDLVCDVGDDCVGTPDTCGVCNGPGAVYDCGCSDRPEGDCDCDGNTLDALNLCGGPCAADADGNGVCDSDEVTEDAEDASDPCDPAPTSAEDYINNQCCRCPSS